MSMTTEENLQKLPTWTQLFTATERTTRELHGTDPGTLHIVTVMQFGLLVGHSTVGTGNAFDHALALDTIIFTLGHLAQP